MKNERLIHAIGKIDDDLIFNAVNDVKAKDKRGWRKWGAIAACLCVALAAAVIYDSISDNIVSDGEMNSSSYPENFPEMVMVNGELYHDSGTITFPDFIEEDGRIVSSCNEVPADNDQSNFGTGYSYLYGENNTIIVQRDDGWHVFVPAGSNHNMDGLTEQEKMEIDPYYNSGDIVW